MDCLLFNCAFISCDVTKSIVFNFLQNLLKTSCSVFCHYHPESVQIVILKVEYLENGLADFKDLVSFCRILNGLSDEISLFRCRSSHLTFVAVLAYLG